jgi:hypothetical protein
MKNAARLVIIFSLCFVIIFLLTTLFKFLGFWISSIRLFPIDSEQGEALINASLLSLPIALFFTILFSLSYSVRRKISSPLSILLVIVLSASLTMGFFLVLERLHILAPYFRISSTHSDNLRSGTGLILSRQDMNVIFLGDGESAEYPRVVSFPERPLIYQEAALGPYNSLLPLPFVDATPWVVRSILIDFSITAREFQTRYDEGFLPFGIYVVSLIFFLASLRFILNLSSWSFANLILGALIFRLTLSLKNFLNASETMLFFNSFLQNRFPQPLIAPMVFFALGSLILLYTFLIFLVRRKRREDG